MNDTVLAHWIKVMDGTFICSGCSTITKPLSDLSGSMGELDAQAVMTELQNSPDKVINGSCSSCNKQYVYRLANGELYLDPPTA